MEYESQKIGDRRLEAEAHQKTLYDPSAHSLDRRDDVWRYGLTTCVIAVYLAGR
jgi:hypothetical protein